MRLKNLYNDLVNFSKQVKIDKIDYKLKNTFNINIIETHFIPDKIRNYINEKIKYNYIISYDYKNINIKLEYYSVKKINTNIFKKILYRIIFMMYITNTFINVNMIIYETPFKKYMNCHNNKVCNNLNTNNVNSGLSYYNNIIIFRKEELLKLVLHEMIHILDVDIKNENIKDKEKITDLYCVNNTNLLINESYVETWATIINVFLILYEKKTIKYDLFHKYLKDELTFGLYQSSKLCKYYNINKFESLHKINNKCDKYLSDDVNVFSYHILKTINLNNIQNFIRIFRDKEYIITKTYNYKKYIMFIIKKFDSIKKNVNFIINTMKNNNFDLSLKMTVN